MPFWPVNSVWQPAIYRDDIRVTKSLPFKERYKVDLSLEVFNLTNSWAPTVPATAMPTRNICLREYPGSAQPDTGLRSLPGLPVLDSWPVDGTKRAACK